MRLGPWGATLVATAGVAFLSAHADATAHGHRGGVTRPASGPRAGALFANGIRTLDGASCQDQHRDHGTDRPNRADQLEPCTGLAKVEHDEIRFESALHAIEQSECFVPGRCERDLVPVEPERSTDCLVAGGLDVDQEDPLPPGSRTRVAARQHRISVVRANERALGGCWERCKKPVRPGWTVGD
jgi:hypothetical protein